jgi:hypothetical protein
MKFTQRIKKLLKNEQSVSDDTLKDVSAEEMALLNKVRPFTMTSPARCLALMRAVDYLTKYHIPGDFVECGVWKGGSSMIMAEKLKSMGQTKTQLYLYDTYEGMSEPTLMDKSIDGRSADEQLAAANKDEATSVWCYSTLEEVEQNVLSTGYPAANLHFVKGKVEDTIPQTMPDKIALLRLDTDWYESTKHELIHLFPRLVVGGILIIDDYGHWEGCRKAVDEYFAEHKTQIFLSRIDYTGRIAVKTQAWHGDTL